MSYTDRARALRRCTAQRKDGEPCRAYARWGDPRRLCASHGAHHTGRMPWPPAWATAEGKARERTHNPPCKCRAYQWPHRPGGGLCRWPDPPEWVCTIPAGTRAWWR
jgi:hypothetical protein